MIKISNFNNYEKIEKYKNLIEEEKEVIEKKKMIIDALTESVIEEIENIVIPYSREILHEAYKQKNLNEDEDKSTYKFVTEDLMKRLGIPGTEITDIQPFYDCVNDSVYLYNFYFTYEGINFNIIIPNVEEVCAESLDRIHYGKYILMYEKKKSVWHYIISSYKFTDIAKEISNFRSNSWE